MVREVLFGQTTSSGDEKRENIQVWGFTGVPQSWGYCHSTVCVHVRGEKNHPCIIRCDTLADIIDSRIPMLVSRNALGEMNGVMDLESSQLMINRRYRAQLQVLPNGHLGLPLADRSDESSEKPDVAMWVDDRAKGKVTIYTLEEEKAGESATEIAIKKMHLHMAHLSLSTMRKF